MKTRERPDTATWESLVNEYVVQMQQPGEMSLSDLERLWKLPKSSAANLIAKMLADGKIECVGYRRNGTTGRLKCYRLTGK